MGRDAKWTEADVEEAGRAVLEALAAGGHLMPLSRAAYGVIAASASAMPPEPLRVRVSLLRELRARDWLKPRGTEPETFALSDPGLFWLRRQRGEADPFGAQHRLDVTRTIRIDGEDHSVTMNEGESPLGWLFRRGSIDALQLEAGERLRRDFTLAQMTPRMAADLGAPLVDGSRGVRPEAELSEIVLAAKQRFSRAMKAAGPMLSDLLFDVCCHLIGLEAAESTRAWPRRAAKVVLVIGLERLVHHYGLRTSVKFAAPRTWVWTEDAA